MMIQLIKMNNPCFPLKYHNELIEGAIIDWILKPFSPEPLGYGIQLISGSSKQNLDSKEKTEDLLKHKKGNR